MLNAECRKKLEEKSKNIKHSSSSSSESSDEED
jgi:hypothetical protein